MKLVKTEYVSYDYNFDEEHTSRSLVEIIDEEGECIGSAAIGEDGSKITMLGHDMNDANYITDAVALANTLGLKGIKLDIANLVAKANELGIRGIKLERVHKTEK